jgi:hypothetical protein
VFGIERLQTSAAPRKVQVKVEAGEGDWTSDHEFTIPSFSPKQWNDLPSQTSWVIPSEGMTFPRSWNRVVVSCD